MVNIAPLVLTVLVGSGATDTTVAVKSGTRLELDCFSGDIHVRAWPKDQVRVVASHSSRARVVLRRSENRLKVDVQTRHGIPTTVDYQITVPTWMALELGGVSTDILVEGVKGHVKASTVSGNVGVRGGGEYIVVESVEGGVQVVGAKGRVEASSINDDIEIVDSSGEIAAETVEGDVLINSVDARLVEVSSVNGNLFFNGPLRRGGVYSLSTHQGDVMVGMPQNPDVTVTVATFDGDISFSFPVPKMERQGSHKRRQTFVLGSGSARLEVDAFQGSIRLEQDSPALKAALERMRAGQKQSDEWYRTQAEWKWKKHGDKSAPKPPTPPTPPTPPDKSDPNPDGQYEQHELEVP